VRKGGWSEGETSPFNNSQSFAYEFFVAFVFGMNRNGGVAQDGEELQRRCANACPNSPSVCHDKSSLF
jgi:hypothetical protein